MGLSELLHVAKSFVSAEIANVRKFDIPLQHRLWLYRNGFLSSKDAIWDLTEETVDLYLSDLEHRHVKQIDYPYSVGLQNKVVFYEIISSTHDHLLPDVYGLVSGGEFVDGGQSGWLRSMDEFGDLLERESAIVKPVTAAKGTGIRVVDSADGQPQIDGRPVGRDELTDILTEGQNMIIMENVSQGDYAANIYPGATNTLRLLTMIDPETGDPFVAAGAHRFGTASSGHVDNWSAGGVSAGIDLDTGELGKAVVSPEGESTDTRWVERHPDTGAQIAGVPISEWEDVRDAVLDLAAEYRWLWSHVGWDVAVEDDQGSVTVLEGEPQSVDADQQAHHPLLADSRVRRFYRSHGVISDNRGVLPL